MPERKTLLIAAAVTAAGFYLFGPNEDVAYARCKLKYQDDYYLCMRADGWRKNRSGRGWHWLVDTSLPKASASPLPSQ